jgi:hypothetical protein
VQFAGVVEVCGAMSVSSRFKTGKYFAIGGKHVEKR